MPGTAVASRRRARQRIMRKFTAHKRDANKRAERLRRNVEGEKKRNAGKKK